MNAGREQHRKREEARQRANRAKVAVRAIRYAKSRQIGAQGFVDLLATLGIAEEVLKGRELPEGVTIPEPAVNTNNTMGRYQEEKRLQDKRKQVRHDAGHQDGRTTP